MNCSTRTEEYLSGRSWGIQSACRHATDERTRDRQAAVLYLLTAGDAGDAIERDYLRRMAAQLVLSKPE
jgi:hypothetical protein